MDPDSLSSSKKIEPRKVRFQPKAPPKRERKLVLPKAEKYENDADGALTEQLLQKLNETKGRPKFERKTGPSQVAFGLPGSSSTSIRSYSAGKNRNQGSSSDGGAEHALEKEYKEPWDYYTYYPVTLPLRRPYSGNPEILDKEEFEGEQGGSDYDESGINSAAELGLMEDYPINNMIFLQLPTALPMLKEDIDKETIKRPSKDKDDKDKETIKTIKRPIKMEELPTGQLGKLLVHRNGALKLKLGDTLYDVSAGLPGTFSQDVVAINTAERHCCNLGELSKRSVVTPDIDSVLDTISYL